MTDEPVVVLGAGSIGLNCAYALACRGADVIVVDVGGVGGGASRLNAGWVTPVLAAPVPSPGVVPQALRWMRDPASPLRVAPDPDPGHVAFMTRMLLASNAAQHERGTVATARLAEGSVDLFRRYAADGLDVGLHEEGMLFAFLSVDERDRHLDEYEVPARFGAEPVRRLSAADVAELEPALSSRVVAGLLSPDQAFVDPGRLMDALATGLRDRGVPLLLDQGSVGLHRGPGDLVEVRTPTQRIVAGTVVVAAGVRSRELAAQVGLRVPLRFGKGYGYDLPRPAAVPRRAVYLSEARVGVTPLPDRLRLAGTMEFGGDQDRVDLRRARGILTAAGTYLSDPVAENVLPWSGLRPMTPDGLPLIGPVPGVPRVVLATGHAMLGITLGPRTGELVADLVLTGRASPVLAPFAADRFAFRRPRRR